MSEHKTKYKRPFLFLFIAISMLFIWCSCIPDTNKKDPSLCEVSISITIDKVLKAENTQKIYYWEFMTTPLFPTIEDDLNPVGVVSYWRRLESLTTDSNGNVKLNASIGKYTAGQWKFELRALNKRGHVIAVGESVDYISKISSNLVEIEVYTDSADGTHGESADDTSRITGITAENKTGTPTIQRYGTLKVGFLVNQLEYDTADMRINTTYQKLEKKTNNTQNSNEPALTWVTRTDKEKFPNWYLAEKETLPSSTGVAITGDSNQSVTEGKVYYETDLSLDAGRYMFSFNIETKTSTGEWKKIGGQTTSVTIIGGEQTEIRGSLAAESYIVSGIVITVPGTISGSINGKGQVISTASKSVTLSWYQTDNEKENSSEKPVSYEWYIEGVKQAENSSTLVFSCPQNETGDYIYGVYRVSLSPKGDNNSWGNADIDIVFLPEE